MQPMQRLSDLLHQEPATAEQAEATTHVIEIALAWRRGELSVDAVRELCTGFERWQAIRFTTAGSEGFLALQALVERLVAGDPTVLLTNHGIVNSEERFSGSVKTTTNGLGKRVWLWPLCFIDGEPQYPPVHLPPGEERREIERAIHARYETYRKAKGGGGRGDHTSARDRWP